MLSFVIFVYWSFVLFIWKRELEGLEEEGEMRIWEWREYEYYRKCKKIKMNFKYNKICKYFINEIGVCRVVDYKDEFKI